MVYENIDIKRFTSSISAHHRPQKRPQIGLTEDPLRFSGTIAFLGYVIRRQFTPRINTQLSLQMPGSFVWFFSAYILIQYVRSLLLQSAGNTKNGVAVKANANEVLYTKQAAGCMATLDIGANKP